MQKSKRSVIWATVVTFLIVAIVAHRIIKIIQKEEKREVLAESVTPRIVWDITLPEGEFIGDLSQVGMHMIYALPDEKAKDGFVIQARRMDDGVISVPQPLDYDEHPLADPLMVGMSQRGKKEFRIENEEGAAIVAQYNIATGERGHIARLPKDCTEFKTVQRLPKNFFALEALCTADDSQQQFKRVMVVEFETRRLTYVSGRLDKNLRFIAFK